MNIINPSIEIIDTPDYGAMLKKIERIGRVCYKSEDKITEDSAEQFVRGIIKRGHESVVEHASFCMELTPDAYANLLAKVEALETHTEYTSFLRLTNITRPLVSGNVRAWRDFLKFNGAGLYGLVVCKPMIELHPVLFEEWTDCVAGITLEGYAKLIDPRTLANREEIAVHLDTSVKFICDRGVSHEIVRHRPASYSQESTRYCNYTDGKFNGHITFIDPCSGFGWDLSNEADKEKFNIWFKAVDATEWAYRKLIKAGATPQEARSILPNSLKTELVMTCNLYEWHHFLRLRASKAAHPQMQEVAHMIDKAFKEKYPVFFEDQDACHV